MDIFDEIQTIAKKKKDDITPQDEIFIEKFKDPIFLSQEMYRELLEINKIGVNNLMYTRRLFPVLIGILISILVIIFHFW